jgi:hypothetical protein
MKKFLYFISIFISLNTFSQSKFITKTGVVNFEASVSTFEEVKATNNAVTAILNSDNGEFAALVLVKGFRFKNALMEEHFNENYAESDTYPKATFKGRIENFSIEKLNMISSLKVDGELNFHGKSIPLNNTDLNITIIEDIISISGSFIVNVSDFDIDIPKIVRDKISEKVVVSFDFNLKNN